MSDEALSRQGTQNTIKYGVMDLVAFLVGRGAALVLKALKASWRVDARQLSRVDEQIAADRSVIAVFWHGTYLPLFALSAGRPIIVFTSLSFRGKVIEHISKAFGYVAFALPDGRSGYQYMRDVLGKQTASADEPVIVALAVDGPLGPRHKVKLGALHIAAQTQALVMPVRLSSARNWVIKSRWDRFQIPLPLARVRLDVGAPIMVPSDFGKDHREVVRLRSLVHDQLKGSPASGEQ